MNRGLMIGLTLLCLAVLHGCASRGLTEYQCLAGDWRTIGERDGLSGAPKTHILTHQNACGRHGVVPDSHHYSTGWLAGIEQYCQPQRGYDQGVAGQGYRGTCPAALADAHRQAYEDGRALFLARTAVQRLENQLRTAERRRTAIDGEMLAAAMAQTQADLTEVERLALLDTARSLLDERRELDDRLPRLALELEDAYRHLDFLNGAVADR